MRNRILKIFAESKKEVLSGDYILDKLNVYDINVLHDNKDMFIINPEYAFELAIINMNDFALKTYYKRSIALQKIYEAIE